jgi:2-polyprenyl-3-methyl-5-hydroxy-6-metoxy-1,4-benzoquinol methylase
MTSRNPSRNRGLEGQAGDIFREEASAFDRQILERVENGHVPDLRRTERCEYFYNNVWRDPVYADLFFGEIVRRILDAAEKHLPHSVHRRRLLEIGSGPGHIALELARHGMDVTGIDLSPACIRIAEQTAAGDPFLHERGLLRYECGNIFEFDADVPFDVVIFSGALHHFNDLDTILGTARSLLAANGLIFASEPVREELKDSDAAIILGIRQSLALAGRYFETSPLPVSDEAWRAAIEKVKDEFAYRDARGAKVQSPLDNEARFAEMYPALKRHFTELEMGFDCCFYDRIIGGLRFPNIEEEHHAARWIRGLDHILCRDRAVTPELFHFIGRKT